MLWQPLVKDGEAGCIEPNTGRQAMQGRVWVERDGKGREGKGREGEGKKGSYGYRFLRGEEAKVRDGRSAKM